MSMSRQLFFLNIRQLNS